MTKQNFKFNWWKIIQFSGIFLILLGVIFAFSSLKVNILLYFGLVTVLIGAINVLIYYIFIGSSSHKKYLQKQNINELKITTKTTR
ncbi:hypothetical protein [Spiroplasma endosymbiont of Virgichneumon dumeticola]|uniref:hypothetical protein n=1 Tax=Spiroplasma endosymbiont of Virgichneumon dumeticola TaxID=3139323 RepID=UPI0035C93F3A